MAIRTKGSRVAVAIAALATGILVASTFGAKADPSKASAGAFGVADVDPGVVKKQECVTPVVSTQGIKVGDNVVVNLPPDLESGLVGAVLSPDIDDLLAFRICNPTAADITAAKKAWTYMAIR